MTADDLAVPVTGAALCRRELVQLRDLLDVKIESLDRLLSRRMDDADKAVTKAETATDKRFEGVNEFRKALQDQTSTFLPRAEYDTAHQALVERLGVNTDRIAALEVSLTGRLSRGEGAGLGAAESKHLITGNATLAIMTFSVLISLAALLVTILAHVHP